MAENETNVNVNANENGSTPTVEELSEQLKSAQETIEKLKQANSKASSDASDWKKKFRETQDENTRTQAEREEEMNSMREKLANYEKQSLKANYKSSYLSMGYDEALAEKKALLMAEGKYDEAIAVEKEFLVAHDKSLKADAVRNTPAPDGGTRTDATTTLEKFKSMSIAERMQFFNDHPEQYAEFTKK